MCQAKIGRGVGGGGALRLREKTEVGGRNELDDR